MATVPVAATSLDTSPVVAALVRYWVVDDALAGNPPSATYAAPTPTAPSTRMARIFSFIDVLCVHWARVTTGAPAIHCTPSV